MTDFNTWVALLRGSFAGSSNGIFDDALRHDLRLPIPQLAPDPEHNAPPTYQWAFLPLSEYVRVPLEVRDPALADDHWVEHLVRQHSRDEMLLVLAALNHGLGRPLDAYLLERLRELLVSDVRASLDAVLQRDVAWRLMSRQGILLAAKAVIGADAPGLDEPDFPPLLTGVLLAQAVLDRIPPLPTTGAELFPTMDGALAQVSIQAYLFEDTDELFSMLTRARRLWLEHPPATTLRATPAELLREATGFDPDTLVKLGLMLTATVAQIAPLQCPVLFQWGEFPFEQSVLGAGLAFLAATSEEMIAELDLGGGGPWDFLVFERHPLVRFTGGGILVMDETLLWRRMSTGLVYPVLDMEKDPDPKDGTIWLKAYGQMSESLVDEGLRQLAVPVVDSGLAYRDGDELKAAYPGQKTADGFLWYGPDAVVEETFAGGPTVGTRISDDFEALRRDLEKQIWDKVEQLDATITAVLRDDRPLTGATTQTVQRIRPLLVQGREFAMTPVTFVHIETECAGRGLLQQQGVQRLAVIEIYELEMLIGVRECTGRTLPDLLTEWCEGPRRGWTLKNHLLAEYSHLGAGLRPRAMTEWISALLGEIRSAAPAKGGRNATSGELTPPSGRCRR